MGHPILLSWCCGRSYMQDPHGALQGLFYG
jgi:hypothetical protein